MDQVDAGLNRPRSFGGPYSPLDANGINGSSSSNPPSSRQSRATSQDPGYRAVNGNGGGRNSSYGYAPGHQQQQQNGEDKYRYNFNDKGV